MYNPDEIYAPDGRKWPHWWSRYIWTDHGFKGVDLTNSILSDCRMLLLVIAVVLLLR